MFYQSQHSLNANTLKLECESNFNFPPHLHNSFELITLTEGYMEITVDQRKYRLEPGSACLIFPNQVHSLYTPDRSRHFLCIFSQKHVQAYNKKVQQQLPASNIFRPDPFYLHKLTDHTITDNPIAVKGVLYSLCAEFDRETAYIQRQSDENNLLFKIFHFVEGNFNHDCTLTALANATSYHYVYLSKFFKQFTGISFTEYVTRYRVNESCYLLKNSGQTILQTAMDCGFDSLRSFNRNFKSTVGMTPSQYRDYNNRNQANSPKF
ncbi:MAG: AraC family transcriptional regulator [Clostridia bacterium]|nr:AraC family transcriptional regulator [Clostridia bacterium]